MKIRKLLVVLVLFNLCRPLMAQDTVRSTGKMALQQNKHRDRNHINDSIKAARLNKQLNLKDTGKHHKLHQTKIPKYIREGYVAISGGYGIPSGSFTSSGYAATGSNFNVSAWFPGTVSHFGLAFKIDYATNPLNEGNYISALTNKFSIPGINYSFTGNIEKYAYKTLLTGLYLTYPGKHFSVDARILGGAMLAKYPSFAVSISSQSNENNQILYQSESKGMAFAIDFGVDARYRFLKKFCVLVSADYLHANPSFSQVANGINAATNSINVQDYGVTNSSQAFSLLNITLGVGYTFSAIKPKSPKVN